MLDFPLPVGAVIIVKVIPAFTQCRADFIPLSRSRAVWKLYALTMRRAFLPCFIRATIKPEKPRHGFTIFLLPVICTYYHKGSPHRRNERERERRLFGLVLLSAAYLLPWSGLVGVVLFMYTVRRDACLFVLLNVCGSLLCVPCSFLIMLL